MPTDKIINLICIGGIIVGIRWMNSPRTARRGNLLGAVSLLAAIAATLICREIITLKILWLSLSAGTVLGLLLAYTVRMIQMPQLVGLLNGFGGAASALVAFLVLRDSAEPLSSISRCIGILALVVGGVTFGGSMIAVAKLDGKMNPRPIVLKGHFRFVLLTIAAIGVLAAGLTISSSAAFLKYGFPGLLMLSMLFGVLFAVRVGGGDMPITISLLNSLSGLAAAIVGLATSDLLSVAVGAIVGSAGLVLTQIMCRAMNSSLLAILAGKTTRIGTAVQPRQPEGAEPPLPGSPAGQSPDLNSCLQEAARRIRQAGRIIIVPGYGMALAQAQFPVKQLLDRLLRQNKTVQFAIHPVAGRMPGHMNVLLAEVDIPYELLVPMEEINPEFPQTDVVLVVGANDVINPAAQTAEGTPIYGMPVLHVDQARFVILCNKDTQPGYAGVNNPLYERRENTLFLPGNAAETIARLLELV